MTTETYQIGVSVSAIRRLIVTVRLRADSHAEARRRATAEVAKQLDDIDGVGIIDVLEEQERWANETDYELDGASSEDFPESKYDADIDLTDQSTEREQAEADRQLSLVQP